MDPADEMIIEIIGSESPIFNGLDILDCDNRVTNSEEILGSQEEGPLASTTTGNTNKRTAKQNNRFETIDLLNKKRKKQIHLLDIAIYKENWKQ